MKSRFARASLALSLTVSLLAPLAASAAPAAVGKTAGKTYGEWSAAWWQWIFAIPAADNPVLAQGEVDCTVGQQGPVWFLAGAIEGDVSRACTVPAGKALFFPVLNLLFTNGPGEHFTVDEKRNQLGGVLNDTEPGVFADFGLPGSRACELYATLDGEEIVRQHPRARVQSPPFLWTSGDGLFGIPAGESDPEAISDGFWVMLPGLDAGQHTLRFGARYCEFDSFADHPVLTGNALEYQLTVVSGEDDDSDGELDGEARVAIVQALYDAFGAGDLATINAIIDEDVIWIESDGIPYGGTFVGRDAVFAGVFAKIGEEWDAFAATVETMFAADGGRVVVLQRDSGTFKATGQSMDAPAASIFTVDDQGRVVHFIQYINTLEVVSATIP